MEGLGSKSVSRFNIFELHCSSLFLRVSVDSHNLAKLVKEGVNGHVGVLLRRHVLDIDGVTARIDNVLLLLRLATTWS